MRCVFLGTAGFLGRIHSDTRCAFWAEEPTDHDFDPDRLIEVDLAASPAAAAAKEISWADVQVDDCFTGPNGVVAGSTLGPRWPELSLAGAVYLERSFLARLPERLRPTCPPAGVNAHDYECTTTVYWPDQPDPRAGNRYTGHHADIVDERGSLAKVEVYPPGRALHPHTTPVTMWIDLASADQCDAGPDSLTAIGVGDAPKSGALFLISGRLGDLT
ncbi:hypothetical protein BJ973_005890 [Actinoplanes tereljensis]|uniref:Uncharacterized protein n=1 Tax=Paractinoplanes tereljensis TaxID=571912 RepID=A0A919TRY6_9ACTN|nr:hypothetical protein [Actinoplanes tereljensis]GIF18845.1 hypothetical protein Ate02nite_15750 [Actinoplanes tereljensis]